jgi:sugar/nucleoside kinase (ribokinase family)
MLDVVGPEAGPGRLHAPLAVRAGGSALNVARAAVRAGAAAAVCGRVGDDAAGRTIRAQLADEGIEDRLAVAAGLRTGCVATLGDRLVADRGANAGFGPDDLRLAPARVLVVSGYVLLREDARAAGVAALAAAEGALRVVDLAAAGLVRGAPLAELLAGVDVVVGDAAAVDAAGGVDALARGRRAAVRTLAADGAEAVAGGERAAAAPPARLPESPWGAGDAFVARFALALAAGEALAEALAAACAFVAAP